MARGLNEWKGIGNLCADPDVKWTASGEAVSKITMACNDSYKKKDSGEVIDTTEFIRITFFRGLAKVVADYLKKGSKVYVSGKLTIRKYQDSNGNDKWATEIVADNMIMLDGKPESSLPSSGQPAHQPPVNTGGGMDDFDESIPF